MWSSTGSDAPSCGYRSKSGLSQCLVPVDRGVKVEWTVSDTRGWGNLTGVSQCLTPYQVDRGMDLEHPNV